MRLLIPAGLAIAVAAGTAMGQAVVAGLPAPDYNAALAEIAVEDTEEVPRVLAYDAGGQHGWSAAAVE